MKNRGKELGETGMGVAGFNNSRQLPGCDSAFFPAAVTKRSLRSTERAFMLIELIAAIAILLLLCTAALPFARVQIIRAREIELRADLRMMREAIDQFKRYADIGMFDDIRPGSRGYPPDLKTLVEGERWGPTDTKYKFLRRIPVDPMTGRADWGLRAVQDDPDSRSWGGQNVFDVYSTSDKIALDGTRYSDW